MTARAVILASLAVGAAITIATPSSARGQAPGPPQTTQVTPPRDGRPVAQTGTAVVRGRVLAADTKRPLRRARITISAPELGERPRTIGTDADGNYEVPDLPAARYRVSVARSGYLPLQYGQTRPLEQGTPLQVLAGQTIEHIDFLLPRMSVISGRISDELGDPVEGVMVMALRSRYWEGQRQLVPVGSGIAMSNDAGEYRILGLTPGMYYVKAVMHDTWTVSQDGVTQVMGYAPTYFPVTTLSTDARGVQVALGQEVNTVDVSLIPGRAASVSGTALDSHGRPFDRVALGEEIRGENFARFGGPGLPAATVAADGTFTMRNVPPGQYKLTATSGRDTEHPEAAIAAIGVDSIDVTGVVLTGSEGGSITGQVRTETGEVPKIPGIRITIGLPGRGQPDPTLLGTFRNLGASEVASNGTFSIKGVFGRSRLRVTLPDEWMVKAIHHEASDITDTPIELSSGGLFADVEIVVTDRVSTLTGAVVNDKGAPVREATVLVFASDPVRWSEDSRSVRSVRPDQQGQFQIKGLPSGEYLAAAVDYVEDGLWNDPEYLESLRRYGQKLTLVEAGTQSISLKPITP